MRFLLALVALAISAGSALAQVSWTPNRPIRLVITYAPGGSADVLGRLIQEPMARSLGVPVVVENRAGAGGNVGTQFIARSTPDGYTIGIGAASTHAINPALFGDRLPFRVPEDFTAIGQLTAQPNILIAAISVPARTPAELMAWLRANPGTSFGTSGVGSTNHLAGELVNRRFGVRMAHVPYRSAGLALNDLAGGHLPLVFDNVSTAGELVRAGTARAIAVTSRERVPTLPDVPTFHESGAPGFDLTSWQGLFGPAGLPPPVVDRLHAAMMVAITDPTVRARLIETGVLPSPSTPAEFLAFIRRELVTWGDLVRASGATAD